MHIGGVAQRQGSMLGMWNCDPKVQVHKCMQQGQGGSDEGGGGSDEGGGGSDKGWLYC